MTALGEPELDLALRALADGNRRAILRTIRNAPQPVGEVAMAVGVSQQTSSHHLRVLNRAGLATTTAEGTRHLFAVNTDGLTAVRSYLDDFWPGKLAALKVAVESRAGRAVAEFRASIDIAAPPEAVFEFLTTERGMTAWLAGCAHVDAAPGGEFAVDIAGHRVRGTFLAVERPRLVVVSWGFAGDPDLPAGASRVEFRLSATRGGTRVDLHHSGLPEARVPGHADGWANFMPRLRCAAQGEDPGPDRWRPLTDRVTATSTTARRDMPMHTRTAHDIVRDYHQAWTTGKVDAAMELVADTITCRAPGQDLTGKDAYRAFIEGFAPQLTGIGDIAEFAEENRVALFYYPQTAVTATAPAAELFTVADGLITESVLIFDRLSYGPPPA